MTSLQNGNYNSRSMNGLTSIYANDIVSDTFNVKDGTVQNSLYVGGNTQIMGTLSIPSYSNVGNTLSDITARITDISYQSLQDMTLISNHVSITKNFTLTAGNIIMGSSTDGNISYSASGKNLKIRSATTSSKITMDVYNSSGTLFSADLDSARSVFPQPYMVVGQTTATTTEMRVYGSSINGVGKSGFMLTSVNAGGSSPASVPMGLLNVIDELFDIAINCGNVANTRKISNQGVQMRFDSRNSERLWQLQCVQRNTNPAVVRNACNATDMGVFEIPTQLDLFANVNMNMLAGSGILNQIGTSGTNQLKATNINSTLSIPSYSDVGATLTSYGTTLTGISYDTPSDTTTIDNNVSIPNGDLTLGTGSLTINNNFIAADVEVSNSLVCDPNVDLTFSSGSGIINQIIPSSSGTNILKSTNVIGVLDVSGNINFTGSLTQNGNPYIANAGTIAITSDNTNGAYYIPFTKTTASTSNSLFIDDTTNTLTYNPSTGGLAVGPITMNSNADLTLQGTGRIVQGASGGTNSLTSAELSSTAKIVGTTTIGSASLTTTFNTRAFNVIDGGGGIRLGRLGTNAAFVELMNFTADGLTENRNATISGSTSSEDRFRFYFRTPAPDQDVMLLRRTQANIYTPLDVSGNITQNANGFIISQSGTGVNLLKDITMNPGATLTQSTSGILSQTGTGTNVLKGITLNNDHLLTLQGVGRIVFPDNSVMRTYDNQPVSDCDMHDYLNSPKVAITSTFDIIYGNPALYSAATANVARFAAVKLKRGQIITGIGLICGNAANHYVALYQKGTTSARLAVSALTATTANVMTYIPFTASYTIPTTDIYYVSSLQTAANMSYYYSIPNNYLNYGPNTMTNGKLDKRAQSATLSGGTYPANIAAGQVFNFENFVFYYVIY